MKEPTVLDVGPMICDRCDRVQQRTDEPWLILKLNVPSDKPLQEKLCPACTEDLVEFLTTLAPGALR